jgi:hypothetical protein
MTTTVALANMPSSVTRADFPFLDQSKLQVRTWSQVDANTVQAEYLYVDGDPTIDTTVSWRSQVDVKNNIVRNSVRLRTIQTVTVDSVLQETAPIEVIITWNTPGRCEDPEKVLAMIGSAYSLIFNGVDGTSHEPNSDLFEAVNRGLIVDLYA